MIIVHGTANRREYIQCLAELEKNYDSAAFTNRLRYQGGGDWFDKFDVLCDGREELMRNMAVAEPL